MKRIELLEHSWPSTIFTGLNFLLVIATTSVTRADVVAEWIRPAPSVGASAVPTDGTTILAHGLNMSPDRMRELAKVLVALHQDVLLVSLTGHHGDTNDFAHVTREQWLDDMTNAYHAARSHANAQHTPLNFFGYSLGGVIGIDGLKSRGFKFDRMILIAPALRVHARSRLVRLAKIFGSGFKIPSMSPAFYRANSGTTQAAYGALFESVDSLKEGLSVNANIPTLVIVDPKDELVDASGLQAFIDENHLSHWHLMDISNDGSTVKPRYHHLVVDEASAGPASWSLMKTAIAAHLRKP